MVIPLRASESPIEKSWTTATPSGSLEVVTVVAKVKIVT